MTGFLHAAGVVLISFCSAAGGFYFSRRSADGYNDLDLICRLIEYIERAIVCARTELPTAFEAFFQSTPHRAGRYFVCGDYRAALACLSLDKRLKGELLTFFALLGQSDAASEEKRCEKQLAALCALREKNKVDLPQKRKVALTLGVCAGAVILLLFW